MKKFILLLLSVFFTNYSFAQVEGSGTITFNSATDVPIEATATSLFDDGAHVYQISGTTNEAIPFGPWYLSETLGESNDELLGEIFLSKNPSGALNLFIKTNDSDEVSTLIYDISGKLISSPEPFNKDNDIIHIYDPMVNASDGLYFVNVTVASKKRSLKFIKNGDDVGLITLPPNAFIKKVETKSFSRNVMANNYVITWNSTLDYYGGSHIVEILEISANTITTSTTPIDGTENGSFAVLVQLNGSPHANSNVTVTNTIVTDSTYTDNTAIDGALAIFANAYVSDANNPTSYQVDIISKDPDPEYLPTTDFVNIFQDDDGSANGVKTIEVTPVPNEQNIIVVVRNYDDLQLLEGATVEMLEATLSEFDPPGTTPSYLRHIDNLNDNIIDSQVTDNEGKVYFNNVSGETDVYFKVYKEGYYRKTNTFYRIPEVNVISKMDTLLNMTAVRKFNYSDNTEVFADTLMWYSPRQLGLNTEFVLGHMNIYISPDLQLIETEIKEHLDELAIHLGFPGAFQYSEVAFPNNPPISDWEYNPYPYDRNVYEGLIGYNLNSGSSQQSSGQWVLKGYTVSFHGIINGYSGLGFPVLDHELGHALGLMHSPPGISFQGESVMPFCCTGVNTAQIVTSKYDTEGLRLWYRLGKLHYDTLDSENRLMDYAMTIRIDEYNPEEENMDSDNDGIINLYDNCPNTPESESANEIGCSESQLDDDFDGISNNLDLCPDTPYGDSVDENGCSI